MPKKTVFDLNQILEIIPHRPPFLFVDRVIHFKAGKIIIAERTLYNDEFWCKGHFPQKPIMPGALVLDALAQTSGLLLGFSKQAINDESYKSSQIFYLAASNIKFLKPSFPGETMELIAETDKKFAALHSYRCEALVGRKLVAKGMLMLASAKGEI